jgi:hypothetical protein
MTSASFAFAVASFAFIARSLVASRQVAHFFDLMARCSTEISFFTFTEAKIFVSLIN